MPLPRNDIQYAVAQDNDGATWQAYKNHYWPALYLIDKQGQSVMCISVKEDIKRLKRTSRLLEETISMSCLHPAIYRIEVIMNNKYKSVPVKSSEITPYSQYLSRRDFLKAAGIVTGSALLAACAPKATGTAVPEAEMPDLSGKDG